LIGKLNLKVSNTKILSVLLFDFVLGEVNFKKI